MIIEKCTCAFYLKSLELAVLTDHVPQCARRVQMETMAREEGRRYDEACNWYTPDPFNGNSFVPVCKRCERSHREHVAKQRVTSTIACKPTKWDDDKESDMSREQQAEPSHKQPGESSQDAEMEAVRVIVEALRPLSPEARLRVLRAVSALLGTTFNVVTSSGTR